jgi:hypothetical protein
MKNKRGVILISSQEEFAKEFGRLCKEFNHLEIYTAWVGNPGNIIPFSHLENLDTVEVYLGVSFDQSSPDGIQYLIDKKYTVTIIDDKFTYHPKLYFFKSKIGMALLMGSSNFTYAGFYQNIETNILLEGNEFQEKIRVYLDEVKVKVGKLNSFIPDKIWLKEYSRKYKFRQDKLKQGKIKEETIKEDRQIAHSSWLSNADWQTYMKHINSGIRNQSIKYNDTFENKISLLNEYKALLPLPWQVSVFQTIENRRRILGIYPYGWLGHVGASGSFQKLLANGSPQDKRTIVNSVNTIAKMEMPINYKALKRELEKLGEIGPTIKVWGRILAITRPDLYCTISSPLVRESLSDLLEKPKSYFETIDGYIELLKLIHQSPWFNSQKPKDKKEQQVWSNRVAFLDVIFY